jgi:hypothetical protein
VTRLLAIAALLLVACGGGGNGGDEEPATPVLHLLGSDVTESDFVNASSNLPQEQKMSVCVFAFVGQEEFIKSLELGNEMRERDRQAGTPAREPQPYETPKPGQTPDPESLERMYTIVRDSCEKDKATREAGSQ